MPKHPPTTITPSTFASVPLKTSNDNFADAPKKKGSKRERSTTQSDEMSLQEDQFTTQSGKMSLQENQLTTQSDETTTFNFPWVELYDQPYKAKYENGLLNDEGILRGDDVDVTFEGCWGIDNILIVNLANLPSSLEETLEPIDPSQWLFFPGAHIQVLFELICLIYIFI